MRTAACAALYPERYQGYVPPASLAEMAGKVVPRDQSEERDSSLISPDDFS